MEKEINDEFLLQCVSKYRPLYDKTDKGFKSLLQKQNCWRAVANSLHRSVPVVKARSKAQKYRREVQIEEKYRRSGAPAISRPTWPLLSFFKCMYGQKHNRATASETATLDILNNDLVEVEEIVDDDDYNGNNSELLDDLTEDISRSSSSCTVYERPTRKKRKLNNDSTPESTPDVNNILGDISNAIKNINERKNASKYDKFAQYLASELNELSKEHADILMENINIQLIEFKRDLRCK